MVDRHDIDALLIGSLYGELSSADEARLKAHLESHPSDRTALEGLTHTRAAIRASRIFEVQLEPSLSASFAAPACAARRFLDSGAQMTRHEIVQSTGMVHVLWILNSTLSSPLSSWANEVQVEIDLVPRSARATGTQIERATAHAAHRVQVAERIAQTSG